MKVFRWDDDELGVCMPEGVVKALDVREGDEFELVSLTLQRGIFRKRSKSWLERTLAFAFRPFVPRSS